MFKAREFQYPDQIAEFVDACNGAVVPFSIHLNSSSGYVLFSNDDESQADVISAALEDYVDNGRGRGFEKVSKDERERVRAAEAAQAEAAEAAQAAAAERVRLAGEEARIRAEAEVEIQAKLEALRK